MSRTLTLPPAHPVREFLSGVMVSAFLILFQVCHPLDDRFHCFTVCENEAT